MLKLGSSLLSCNTCSVVYLEIGCSWFLSDISDHLAVHTTYKPKGKIYIFIAYKISCKILILRCEAVT